MRKINSEKFGFLLEEFHARRWFPSTYPDPFGEFIDFVREESLPQLPLYSAYYIYRIIPSRVFADLYREFRCSYDSAPRSPYYYLRMLSADDAEKLWRDLQDWSERYESLHQEWFQVLNHWRAKQEAFEKQIFPGDMSALQKRLKESRDLFAGRIQQINLPGDQKTSIPGFLRRLRLPEWDAHADWNDFPAIAAALQPGKLPAMRRSENDPAEQIVFPITPPSRVIQYYGEAAGPVDVLRFLAEHGKACFYSGMNPALPAEQRIAGDPQLPYFWGSLFVAGFTSLRGIEKFIPVSAADQLQPLLGLVVQFWFRYEALLSLYHRESSLNWNQAHEHYQKFFDLAFPFRPPSFLYLYEFERSEEAAFRCRAWEAALAAEERLKTLYGSDWFTSDRWARKMRDCWWEGFGVSLNDVLSDIGVTEFEQVFLR